MESSLSMGPSANLCPMAIEVNISAYLLHQGLRLCTELFICIIPTLQMFFSVFLQLAIALPIFSVSRACYKKGKTPVYFYYSEVEGPLGDKGSIYFIDPKE